MSLFNNDEAVAFFVANGYPSNYNDGMLAWLRDVFNVTGSSLPDLLARYLREYGDRFNMIVAGKSAVSSGATTAPAATFTSTTPTDGGSGTVVLTSAGAHGLTSANAVGRNIYISAGTGWTPGLYPITAIDLDTTGVAVTITATWDAGLGSPTVSLVDDDIVLGTVTIPILKNDSYVKVDATWTCTDSANEKRPSVIWGTDDFYRPNLTNDGGSRPTPITIQNRGATNSQVSAAPATQASMSGGTSATLTTATIDTSVATTITLGGFLAAADEQITLEKYIVEVVL